MARRRKGADFWASVRKTDSCWLWTAAFGSSGYGAFWFLGKLRKAHRVSWFLEHGKWPMEQILHRCDVPSCVNPKHLWEGTQRDNVLDAIAKGRLSPGEHNRKKTHCPYGHAYAVHAQGLNTRRCGECHRVRESRRRSNISKGVLSHA